MDLRPFAVPPPELPLRTERLVLRLHLPTDLDAVLDYQSRPEVARYLLEEPWTREEAQRQLDKRLRRRHVDGVGSGLSLVAEHAGRVVGDVGLWPADETLSRGEVGWVFHPDWTGRGLATEAVCAVLDLAFGHYRMHRVKADLDPRNTASARMCERLGMTKEAHLRQDWWSKGEWTDNAVYGLLASEHAAHCDHAAQDADPAAAQRRAAEASRSGTPEEQAAVMSDFNAGVVEEFRAHHGRVGGPFEGSPMLLLHSTGARSGRRRLHPMVYRPEGSSYLVFASKAGADDHPAWYHNLKAHPHARIEVGDEVIAVRAEELPRAERDEVYAAQAADRPAFADYQARTDRVIPVLRLTPTVPPWS
ncbi:nitroreductase/quinone reductase family protein [Marmoricola endophyticus]|nr:nitroreductase/quinone reductase family protein [Marmoricola endophyticus]